MSSSISSSQTADFSTDASGHSPYSADDLFRSALESHQEGDAEQAISLYLQAIEREPAHVDACFYLAMLYNAVGDTAAAVSWFTRAHELAPAELVIVYQLGLANYSLGNTRLAIDAFHKTISLDAEHWEAAYNLGTAYFSTGRLDDAIEAYHMAARLNPQDADIHFNLGLTYKKAGKLEEAMQSYLCALEIAPDDAEVHYNLAMVYKGLDCKDEAITAFEIAIALNPDFGPAHGNLGVLYLDRDRVDEAIACYERLIELNHNVTSARHILAALTGRTTDAAPSSYVKDLFDSFSGHFDERLVLDLEYRTPWELKDLLLARQGEGATFDRLLDLGCGTGLVGQVFSEITRSMTGIDLSPKMIEKAREKEIYDHLAVDDVVGFLESDPTTYDLIVASDVLIYVGEMESIVSLLPKRLTANGRILISTEHLDGKGYTLRPSGRYAHAPSYIEAIAGENGLEILETRRTNIRKEKGQWIIGELFLMGLRATDN